MLNDTRIRYIGISEIHHRIALIVRRIKDFFLEPNGTVFEFAKTIIEILIKFTRI